MLLAGFVRASVIAKALGVAPSSVLRRLERGLYRTERAGKFWFIAYADVLAAKDTSKTQAEKLSQEVSKLLASLGDKT